MRVAQYVNNMVREVTVIAHACGVDCPRQLQRRHVRMVIRPGVSVSLDELYASGEYRAIQVRHPGH